MKQKLLAIYDYIDKHNDWKGWAALMALGAVPLTIICVLLYLFGPGILLYGLGLFLSGLACMFAGGVVMATIEKLR